MGFVIPLTLGALSSATITFVYKASSFRMDETHAMMWGFGQTVVHAAFGITRILATLWNKIGNGVKKGKDKYSSYTILLEIQAQEEKIIQWHVECGRIRRFYPFRLRPLLFFAGTRCWIIRKKNVFSTLGKCHGDYSTIECGRGLSRYIYTYNFL